jgi:hypothetical protein
VLPTKTEKGVRRKEFQQRQIHRAAGVGADAQEIEDGIWEIRGDLNSHSVKRSNSLTAGGANENGRGQV